MSRALVYVQLQHNLLPCFWDSLRKVRECWDGDIYLIAPRRESGYAALEPAGVKFIAEDTVKDNLLEEYRANTFFEKIHIGWDGFWDNACKRFMYLHWAHQNLGITELLHIETDVVPYMPLGEMFDAFASVYHGKLVFSPHADTQLSCCTMYCNNPGAMELFCREIVEYFKRGTAWFTKAYPSQAILNETHFAYTFWKEHPEHVDLLPTMPGEPHADTLGFLVDPTAWGMWVDGLHRTPGARYAVEAHHVGHLILAGKYDIHFSFNRDQLSLPYVYDRITGKSMKLATLHFNSKRSERWI